MEKDVKLREFCLQLALTLVPKGPLEAGQVSAKDVVEVARELEQYINTGN